MSALEIFGGTKDAYTTYEARLQIRDIIVGGIPSDPSVIRKWLEARLGAGDDRLQEVLAQTIEDRDGPLPTVEEQLDALMKTDAAPSVNGFKRNSEGVLCYEGRCLKGALKEWANSAYPGVQWDGKKGDGGTLAYGLAAKKGLMSTLAERVFVSPRLVSLGVREPSRVEERIKRVRLPDGRPASAISRVEVVDEPELVFIIRVRDNFLTNEAWSRIWQSGEEIGIGADRARSDGMFDLVSWKKVS